MTADLWYRDEERDEWGEMQMGEKRRKTDEVGVGLKGS
jgi:hypothetical protein